MPALAGEPPAHVLDVVVDPERLLHDDIGQILTSARFAVDGGAQESPGSSELKLNEARAAQQAAS